MSSIKVGDLVRVNQSLSEWAHLESREENHCLRGAGIVVEIRAANYVIRFGTWTAYLIESDLTKLRKEGTDE